MRRCIFYIMCTILLFAGCKNQQKAETKHYAMYYWRTTLKFTDSEKQWMKEAGVETVYLRLFDVVEDTKNQEIGMRPEATIKGLKCTDENIDATLLKGKRIIPVVFIAPGVISKDDGAKVQRIAELILQRIDDITELNGLGKCDEIQIDYDWAQSNGKVYFSMLQCLADKLHAENRRLSTTIRLHQLSMTPPPVDRGILMLYNTGKVQSIEEKNSILSKDAVAPYLRHLEGYKLPLSLALPRFSWNVVFRDGEFAFIAPGLVLSDTASFKKIDETHWLSLAYQPVPITASATTQAGQRLLPGDVIRREESCEELNREMTVQLGKIRPQVVEEIVYYGPPFESK